jgi:16S rRNA (cytosine1402-N4)-methyltransferase
LGTVTYHEPVLAQAVVRHLTKSPDGPIVDGTAGGGGHLKALALATEGRRPLIGIDCDDDALQATRVRTEGHDVTLLKGNFADLKALLGGLGRPPRGFAGILLDLGVSSWQLDNPARGFGLKHEDGPLDMRMDQASDASTALQLVERLDVESLTTVLKQWGEVPAARRIATRIKEAVADESLQTTGDLRRVIEQAVPRAAQRRGAHPATTVFQALRIAVNGELDALEQVLEDAPDLLMDGGRLAIIAYHSLEDRRVKHTFRRGARGPDRPGHLPPPSDWSPTWEEVTRKPVVADEDEIARNPRARSARLRVAARAAEAGGAR